MQPNYNEIQIYLHSISLKTKYVRFENDTVVTQYESSIQNTSKT
jgi:hypothetical protein